MPSTAPILVRRRFGLWLSLAALALPALAGCTPAGVAVGAGATAGVAAMQERGFKGAMSDTRIRIAVNDQWLQHDEVMYRKLNLQVQGGRALLSGLVTSLPELVTTLAAVRRGALTLAVSDIVGGNFFDVLFIFAADIAFIHGSLYHADGVGMREVFLLALTLLLSAVLLLGLLYRQRRGPANIGFESVLMLAIYVLGYLALSQYM